MIDRNQAGQPEAPGAHNPHAAPKTPWGLYATGVVAVAGATLFAASLRHTKLAATQEERDARTHEAALGVRVLGHKVARTSGSRQLTLPGELHPLHQATVYAKTAGYLQELGVDKGDTVRRGQVLGRIASPETDQQLERATADLLLRRQKQRRLAGLVQSGIVSQQEMDEAQAALASAQAEHARLTSMKGYEVLVAPFDGVVTARYVDPGALLSAATSSTSASQPIVELQQMDTVRVFIYVAQRQAGYIKVGDKATVGSPDLHGPTLQATVTRTARAIDPRTRTMLVEVDVDNHAGVLTPGMFVQVTLTLDVPPALQVPTDAVFLRQGQPYVVVLDGGVAHFRRFEAGVDDGHFVEVLGGLKEGEMVGLHVGDDVSEGSPVRVTEGV